MIKFPATNFFRILVALEFAENRRRRFFFGNQSLFSRPAIGERLFALPFSENFRSSVAKFSLSDRSAIARRLISEFAENRIWRFFFGNQSLFSRPAIFLMRKCDSRAISRFVFIIRIFALASQNFRSPIYLRIYAGIVEKN